MDQLVNMVTQKTGISQEHARTAVDTVLGYLKQHLPDSVAGQIDSIAGGQGSQQSGGKGGVAQKVGDMFGK